MALSVGMCLDICPACIDADTPHLQAIFVGPAKSWIPELVERAKALKVGGGFEQGSDLSVRRFTCRFSIFNNVSQSGPVISPAAKEKISRLIGTVADEGGIIHLDGRGVKVPGYENGNFVGPSVVQGTVTMEAYKYTLFNNIRPQQG